MQNLLRALYKVSFLFQALEVCVDNVESALNAFNGGAKRIELCSALNLGGLTPSVGLLKTIKKLLPPNFIIFVMIRPKPGEDYVYDEHDIEVMTEDIKILKANGADGFVFGCLDKERYIDVEACRKLLMVAEKFPCTFHRAFDVLKNPEESLEIIINLGFSRVLTSGQEKTAYLGRNLIKKLVLKVKELGSDIIIVAGGGIDLNNLREILSVTQVKEYHGSAKTGSLENYDKEKVVFITNESIVRKMIEISKNVF